MFFLNKNVVTVLIGLITIFCMNNAIKKTDQLSTDLLPNKL